MSFRVSTIPSHDRVFRRVVDKLVREPHAGSPEELESALRAMFPPVAVFQRQLSGEHLHLYAYRDGRYERPTHERWWDGPGVACACVDPSNGHVTHLSDEWADLLGVERISLIGRHYSEFVLPDARAAAVAMFEALQERGEIDTEALVVRGDGSPLSIELHATRIDDEIDVRWRPKPER
jgi:PAS domain S-box-containing protein